MGNSDSMLPSGIDLITESIKHYEFIRELNFTPSLFHPNNIKLAIVRYEKYWLPFCCSHPEERLVAPLDIELIWIVHLLNPLSYERDCFAIAGEISVEEYIRRRTLSKNCYLKKPYTKA